MFNMKINCIFAFANLGNVTMELAKISNYEFLQDYKQQQHHGSHHKKLEVAKNLLNFIHYHMAHQ
jgi:hypothetical protein